MSAAATFSTLDEKPWDAVIVGAGVAGGVAANLLGGRGWRVLLVERQAWPRDKACGGCLNAAGVRMLRSVGLGEALAGASTLSRFELHVGKKALSLEMPAGVAVARRTFDAALVEAARKRGGERFQFVPECGARILETQAAEDGFRGVRLKSDGQERTVQARVVLACDGVNGSALADQPWAAWEPAPASWIGVAATLHGGGALEQAVGPSTIAMFVEKGGEGYVGVVRQAAGQVHVGAAVSPAACNRARGAGRVLGEILADYGVALAGLEEVSFEGTRPLTGRRHKIAGPRVLVVGDSCGYVEPFTGEGMSWAIRGALAAVSILPRDLMEWETAWEANWQALYEREVARRQAWCWRVRGLVRNPRVAKMFVTAGRLLPGVARRLVRRIGA